MKLLLIRSTINHSVIAHIKSLGLKECVLHRLSADAGNVPDYQDLVGITFPSFHALRQEIKNRMRAMPKADSVFSTLDKIKLPLVHLDRWKKQMIYESKKWQLELPNGFIEQVEVKHDGRLIIFIKRDTEIICCIAVQPGAWEWLASDDHQ